MPEGEGDEGLRLVEQEGGKWARFFFISEYQYKSSFVVDQEINLVAFMTELMMRCEYR